MKDKNDNDVTSASLAENSVVIAFRDSDCTVVSGFDDMAAHLEEQLR